MELRITPIRAEYGEIESSPHIEEARRKIFDIGDVEISPSMKEWLRKDYENYSCEVKVLGALEKDKFHAYRTFVNHPRKKRVMLIGTIEEDNIHNVISAHDTIGFDLASRILGEIGIKRDKERDVYICAPRPEGAMKFISPDIVEIGIPASHGNRQLIGEMTYFETPLFNAYSRQIPEVRRLILTHFFNHNDHGGDLDISPDYRREPSDLSTWPCGVGVWPSYLDTINKGSRDEHTINLLEESLKNIR